MLRFGTHDNSTTQERLPGAGLHQPVMQHDRLPGLIEGYTGVQWRDRFAGWRLLRAHGAIVGP